MKGTDEQSLRCQVDKWLAPGSSTLVHVVKFSRTLSGGRRYVCVGTSQPAGLWTLYFFRHDDGCWRVFPPTVDSPKKGADHLAL